MPREILPYWVPAAILLMVTAGSGPALADGSGWFVETDFMGGPCRSTQETPDQFAARIGTAPGPEIMRSEIQERDGSTRVDFWRGSQHYRFWTSMLYCGVDVRADRAEADPYK